MVRGWLKEGGKPVGVKEIGLHACCEGVVRETKKEEEEKREMWPTDSHRGTSRGRETIRRVPTIRIKKKGGAA